MIDLLFLLMVGHAVADYGLQTKYIAENKSPYGGDGWVFTLLAHSLIHAGMVFFITGLAPVFPRAGALISGILIGSAPT